MVGSTSGSAPLRQFLAQGDPASLQNAVDLALTMSVAAVRGQLDDDFLDAHAEGATSFFESWLARLPAFERMAAAAWAGPQHVLSLVHVDQAYGRGARLVLEALTGLAGEAAQFLEDRVFTEGPDAAVAEAVADRLDGVAAVLRTARDELADELALLPRHPAGPATS